MNVGPDIPGLNILEVRNADFRARWRRTIGFIAVQCQAKDERVDEVVIAAIDIN